jgi:hypothetical protein
MLNFELFDTFKLIENSMDSKINVANVEVPTQFKKNLEMFQSINLKKKSLDFEDNLKNDNMKQNKDKPSKNIVEISELNKDDNSDMKNNNNKMTAAMNTATSKALPVRRVRFEDESDVKMSNLLNEVKDQPRSDSNNKNLKNKINSIVHLVMRNIYNVNQIINNNEPVLASIMIKTLFQTISSLGSRYQQTLKSYGNNIIGGYKLARNTVANVLGNATIVYNILTGSTFFSGRNDDISSKIGSNFNVKEYDNYSQNNSHNYNNNGETGIEQEIRSCIIGDKISFKKNDENRKSEQYMKPESKLEEKVNIYLKNGQKMHHTSAAQKKLSQDIENLLVNDSLEDDDALVNTVGKVIKSKLYQNLGTLLGSDIEDTFNNINENPSLIIAANVHQIHHLLMKREKNCHQLINYINN